MTSFRSLLTISVMACSFALPLSTGAADLVGGQHYQMDRAQKTTPHHARRAVSTISHYENCDQLLVTYRSPYQPRTELVSVCHPPIY
ncbi:hypothetical protein [Rhizobium sp. FY34]|uniref:hypothetical protein n=1 Tax=Rhizobium sp. FY34 TaxID=2562309 RepID=UPI0010C13C77|nr:hypothetical protein [Rhizobium sp. FY34]